MKALRSFPRSLITIWGLAAAVSSACGDETAYWIWGKQRPVAKEQCAELQRQCTRVLYRQAAVVDGKQMPDAVMAGTAEFSADGERFSVVPVVRVESREVPSAAYFARLRNALPVLQGEALQVDFDCPDRLLADYGALLRELRRTWPKLSVTALAHWPSLKDFPDFARSSGEICPMFYDLQRDPTGVGPGSPPPPILDPQQVAPLLEKWRECPVPWRAGLPNFTRVTIFDHTGLSRGQIFGWEWPEIVFNPRLRSEAAGTLGVQLLRVSEPTQVARRALLENEWLAVRQTDPGALAQCRAAATRAGAAGVILFRLPAPGDESTHSLRALASGIQGAAEYVVRYGPDALILENRGTADLEPKLAGTRHDRDRGHTLEIDAPAPYFREAEPGSFHRVTAHVSPDSEPRVSPVALATRLTFWISHLDAGAALRSGLFQLAPHVDASRLRWRLDGGPWKPLTSP